MSKIQIGQNHVSRK